MKELNTNTNIENKELKKLVENYKINQVSDFYEIKKVSEFIDHISDCDSVEEFKECVNNSIEKLERLLETDKVAYCCMSDNEVYSFSELLQIWEEDQEFDQCNDLIYFDSVEDLFIYLKNNGLMYYYNDFLLLEKIKKEIGSDNQPFVYDFMEQVLIKGE